ncbi:MAG: hypothetical protein ACTSYA_09665 [Candidatus Kariarchaeaceae archaeon]
MSLLSIMTNIFMIKMADASETDLLLSQIAHRLREEPEFKDELLKLINKLTRKDNIINLSVSQLSFIKKIDISKFDQATQDFITHITNPYVGNEPIDGEYDFDDI